MSNTDNIRVVPTGGALGADVWGIDLADMTDAAFDIVHRAWLDHDGVVRLPGQFAPVEATLAFAARFGELDLAPISTSGKLYRPDLPHLTVISNIVEDGRELGALGHYESKWHTDMSYNDVPPKASILHAVELPKSGGDTGYCNMYTVYDTLDDVTRARIENLHCKHDASRNSVGEVRAGYEKNYADRNSIPGAVHPLVCEHPETGRRCLYLGRRDLAFIPELDDDESTRLLDQLWAHADNPDYHWYQRWRLGDVVVWDNRCTMHRRDALDPTERRLLNRAQVKGEVPIGGAQQSTRAT